MRGTSGCPCPWIDSHAHLTMFPREEVPEVLDRAAAAGVAGVLVPATGPEDLEVTLELAGRFPGRVVAAVGVHPHEASTLDTGLRRALVRMLDVPGVVAVGEIGLDYHYMSSPREDQLQALRWQLDLALETDLPVVLHNRESWDDLRRLLGERAGELRGVCHSFTEGPAEAAEVTAMGLLVGISGMVTFRRGDNIREMARSLEPEQVLVETDSPYLTPVPYRGKRNEPAFVVETAQAVAEELDMEPEELSCVTFGNFRRLFGTRGWPEA